MTKECTREKPVGQEVAMAVYTPGTTRVPLNIQTSAIEHRWPKHNFQSTPETVGWATRTACLEGCLACTSCAYSPALLNAIARNQPAVAVELF